MDKNRDQADAHKLFNSASGATKYVEPNDTSAQATDANSLTSFDSDGFLLVQGQVALMILENILHLGLGLQEQDQEVVILMDLQILQQLLLIQIVEYL